MKTRLAIIFLASAFLAGCSDKTSEPGEPPPIKITSPVDNATLTDPVIITAAAGTGYAFARVDFYLDGDSVWSDSAAPYQYYWDIFVYSGSSQHSIFAIGYTADTSYTSAAVSAYVSLTSGFSLLSAYAPSALAAYGVTNYNNVMFVATGPDGLEILNVIDKSSPTYISRFDTPGQAMKADVYFPYVFIADYSEGVTRADFSNPDSLLQRGIFTSQAVVNDVAVSGNYLYIAEDDGLSIVGFADPDSMNFISKVGMSGQGQPQFVVVRGDTAFVAALSRFYIIDCTTPASPSIISAIATAGQANGVAVDGDLAFVADGSEGVITLSIIDPANPVEISRYNTGQQVITVDTGDSVLFAGALSGGVYALDYSQPDTLSLADQIDTGNMIWQVHADGPYLYVATSGNVVILRYLP